jgi:hypothetical protein
VNPTLNAWIAWMHARRGRVDLALPHAEAGYTEWSPMSRGTLAGLLAQHGDRARADALMQPLRAAPDAYGAPRGLAAFHYFCDDVDDAVRWFARAIEQRDPLVPEIAGSILRSSKHWPQLADAMMLR